MKILFKIVSTLTLILSLTNTASANDRGVNGLIIGGGAGAIMGQVVGRNVESTIIGATVGGIIGAVIGAERHHSPQKRIIVHKPSRRQHGSHFRHSPRNYSPRITHNRPHSKQRNYHRDTIVVYKQHDGRKRGHYHNFQQRNRKQLHSSNNRHRQSYKNSNRW